MPPVESYVRSGYNVNATDKRRRTLLQLAAAGGHLNLCRFLISAGADPTLRDAQGDDALAAAVANGRYQVEALLRASLAGRQTTPAFTTGGGSLARPIVPMNSDGGSGYDDEHPDEWETSVDTPAPPGDPSLRNHASRLQDRISGHVPDDRDATWSDIDVELPESATHEDPDRADWLNDVRRLIDLGLARGRLAASQVTEVAAGTTDPDVGGDVETRLRFVLGDLGIRVEEDSSLESVAVRYAECDTPPTDDNRALVDEGIAFLENLSQARDLQSYYWKDASGRELLSAAEERALAIRMEAADQEILGAILQCPRASRMVLEWASRPPGAGDPDELADRSDPGHELHPTPDTGSEPAVVQFRDSNVTPTPVGADTSRHHADSLALVDSRQLVGNALDKLDLSEAREHMLLVAVERDMANRDVKRALMSAMCDKEQARRTFAEANLRLVAWWVQKHGGISFLDRVQEGNIGLLKAVARFDHRRGGRFSTYATWWIRQAVSRAVADTGRLIRLPVHMIEITRRIKKATDAAVARTGREPDSAELARQLDEPETRIRNALTIPPDAEAKGFPHDYCPDSPEPTADGTRFVQDLVLRLTLDKALDSLSARESGVLRMRFGLEDGTERTLHEIGQKLHVTRERIRQIEKAALGKLRCELPLMLPQGRRKT